MKKNFKTALVAAFVFWSANSWGQTLLNKICHSPDIDSMPQQVQLACSNVIRTEPNGSELNVYRGFGKKSRLLKTLNYCSDCTTSYDSATETITTYDSSGHSIDSFTLKIPTIEVQDTEAAP